MPGAIISLGKYNASETCNTNVPCERGWSALKVHGPLDFGLTGVLSSMASPLAHAGIPIFVVSTFDTDYLLMKATNMENGLSVLREEGFDIKATLKAKL